jgi:hypothetical protein
MWEFVRVPRLKNGDRGECDPPTKKNKQIRILKRLKGEELLEVRIHEIIHAGLWDIDEDAVAELSRDAARAIWKWMMQE